MSRTNLPPPEHLCNICSSSCVTECVKCETCDEYVHPHCAKLPAYALVNWFTTRHKYKCEPCVRSSLDIEEYDSKYAFVIHLLNNTEEKTVNNNISECEGSISEQPTQEHSDTLISTQKESDSVNCELQKTLTESNGSQPHPPPQPHSNPNPNLPNNKSYNNSTRKAQLCRFYKTHSCKHGRAGKNCDYAHPKVCYKYRHYGRDLKRGCTSQTCNHYHPTICKNSEKDRLCLHLKFKFHLKGTRRNQPHTPTTPTTILGKPSRPYPPPHTHTHSRTVYNQSSNQATNQYHTYTHAIHGRPTNQSTNQYHHKDDSHIDHNFLYLDLLEMKSQLAQLMRLFQMQENWNLVIQRQHHPGPLPNMTLPPPVLH